MKKALKSAQRTHKVRTKTPLLILKNKEIIQKLNKFCICRAIFQLIRSTRSNRLWCCRSRECKLLKRGVAAAASAAFAVSPRFPRRPIIFSVECNRTKIFRLGEDISYRNTCITLQLKLLL